MSQKRIETDSLGDIEVPKDALYGAQTQRAIENFDFYGRAMPTQFIEALALVKKSAAEVNQQLGCIEPKHAQAISWACDQIIKGEHVKEFPVNVFQTGSGTSSNMNINEVIATLANQRLKTQVEPNNKAIIWVHPNDQVNYGQSSNDVIPTTIQLAAVIACHKQLLPALQKLHKKISKLSKKYQPIIKTARTHLMDALPISLGDELATWAFQIAESESRINDALKRVSLLPIGGTAIGSGLNSHPDFSQAMAKHLSELTAIEFSACENLGSRISAQDSSLELHGQLKVLATVLTKQANDLRWMNSGPNCGLAEIQLKALQPGSSIMPGKVNPVICEAVLMMCAEVIGNDSSVTLCNQSGNFQLNVMLPLIADKLLASIALLSDAAIIMADKALLDFNVLSDKLKKQAEQNPVLATALNPMIGYDLATKIAKIAAKDQRSVLSVALELTDLSEQELTQILKPALIASPFKTQDN